MLKMFGERVMCKRIGSSRLTSSGVIKTSTNKEKPLFVEVVSSGIWDIKPGDSLLVARYSGMEIEYDDEDFVIIDKDDIIAKVVEGGAA